MNEGEGGSGLDDHPSIPAAREHISGLVFLTLLYRGSKLGELVYRNAVGVRDPARSD